MADFQNERLFDHDPLTGITEYFSYDPKTGEAQIETRQEFTELAEINQFLRNDTAGWKGDLHLVASYPLTIWMDLKQRGMLPEQDQDAYRKWLNDSDNRVFRTKLGRV